MCCVNGTEILKWHRFELLATSDGDLGFLKSYIGRYGKPRSAEQVFRQRETHIYTIHRIAVYVKNGGR